MAATSMVVAPGPAGRQRMGEALTQRARQFNADRLPRRTGSPTMHRLKRKVARGRLLISRANWRLRRAAAAIP